jgi:hypothetical protein
MVAICSFICKVLIWAKKESAGGMREILCGMETRCRGGDDLCGCRLAPVARYVGTVIGWLHQER